MLDDSAGGWRWEFVACVAGTMAGIALLVLAAMMARILPPFTYYFLPSLTAVVLCAGAVTLHLASKPGVRYRAGVIEATVVLLPVLAYGLSLAILTENFLLSRWLAWNVFQIHDAGDFISASVELLLKGEFETVRGRPIAKLVFAGLIDLLHFNVHGALWLTTAAAAAAAVVLAGVVGRLMGCAASLLAGYILFDFSHEHIGGLTSEIPGFVFGTIGVALLLHAAASGAGVSFAAGYAILCLAMVTRVGAIFVLPALLWWSYWYHPPLLGRRWAMAVAGFLISAGVFLGNQSIAKIVIPTSGGSFANTADLWYGTIVQGQASLGTRKEADLIPVTRWVQIYADHPELGKMPRSEQSAAKFKILVQTAARYPAETVIGGLREIWGYIVDIKVFRFIEFKPLRIAITLSTYFSVWQCFVAMRKKRDPVAALLFSSAVALVLSQPFLFGGETRATAPTVGFLAALAGYGVRTQFGLLRSRMESWPRLGLRSLIARIPPQPEAPARSSALFAYAGMVLFAAAFAVSAWGFASRSTWRPADQIANEKADCGPLTAVSILTHEGAIISLKLWNGLTVDELDAKSKRLEAFFVARYPGRSITSSDLQSDQLLYPTILRSLREGKKVVGYVVNLADRTLIVPAIFSEFRAGRSIACLDQRTGTLSYPSSR